MASSLLLVGCGKMGSALLERCAGQAHRTVVVDPSPLNEDLKSVGAISFVPAFDKIDPQFRPDIIILAVKPQQMSGVLPHYAHFKDSVFLSIAAGSSIAKLTALLGRDAFAIVRSMPNLPASIGLGMTVAVANKCVNAAQRALCDHYLNAMGQTAWLENEDLLDAVTALSGSGPAYVFALAEAMTEAGKMLGLPEALAAQLTRQTIAGSGALLSQSSESAEILLRAVTSPGGTTEAALHYLLGTNGLPNLMLKTMQAAARRSKELAQ